MTTGTASASSNAKLTPMMEQYRSIKRTLPPQTILFLRLGDFYEMFFEDAVQASEILNITLTGREGGEAGRIPMCGVPYHSYQGYVKTLLDHNLKVAICEQIGDPKAAKGLVERKISRIITPATYLDEDAKSAAAEYMAAIVQDRAARERAGQGAADAPTAADRGVYALALLEVSTGEFFVREVQDDRLFSELSLLVPREVILPADLAARQDLSRFLKDTLNAGVTTYEPWVFEFEDTSRLLRETFKLASDRSLPCDGHPLCISACGALLYYLNDHQQTALEHIQLPRLLQTADYMVLDRQTQRSLELVTNMSGHRSGTLIARLDQTRTSMGGRALHQWVTHPLLSVAAIKRRQSGVEELVNNPARLQEVRAELEGIKDVERSLSRLNFGVANARDLLNLSAALERLPRLQAALSSAASDALRDLSRDITPLPELRALITSAIVDAPPLTTRDGDLIRDGYSSELDELRALAAGGRSALLAFQQREIERTGIKSLRIKYSQVFGYTIEVSKANLHLVPADYHRKQTLANAERFIVPELNEWAQKITGAEERGKLLEYELFCALREAVLEHLPTLQAMARALGTLDALQSLAVVALQRRWVLPDITDGSELFIKEGRHPVVEAMLPQGQFVANDTHLDTQDNQLVILTGPNMAGKSTYIRQVALIALLAHIGSYVPAQFARIGLVDRIFTRVGASDNLAGGESTFMVEMVETAHILRNATQRSLLILDEIGRGTSTFDGVSIAWAVCEHLAGGAVRPRTLFATHYHELTQLAEHFPHITNATMTVKDTPEGIVFLRKVKPGASDRSYGIHVARLAGVPSAVTDRADAILKILESENTEASRIIEGGADESLRPAQADAQFTWFAGAATGSGAAQGAPQQAPPPAAHSVLKELRELSIDSLSPLDALNRLAAWKQQLCKEISDDGHSS